VDIPYSTVEADMHFDMNYVIAKSAKDGDKDIGVPIPIMVGVTASDDIISVLRYNDEVPIEISALFTPRYQGRLLSQFRQELAGCKAHLSKIPPRK
jgi:hypothetical protein